MVPVMMHTGYVRQMLGPGMFGGDEPRIMRADRAAGISGNRVCSATAAERSRATVASAPTAAAMSATATATAMSATAASVARTCAGGRRRSASRISGRRGEDGDDKNQRSDQYDQSGKHGISPNQPM
jgi:hypothetical protein